MERDEYNREARAAFNDVERRAVEQYVFALCKGWSEAGRRLRQKHGVDTVGPEIREVTLEGEYPDTVIKVLVYLPHLDSESWRPYSLWKTLAYYVEETAEEKQIRRAEKLAGDILMWAEGG